MPWPARGRGRGYRHGPCSKNLGILKGGPGPVETYKQGPPLHFNAKEGYPLNQKKQSSLRHDEKKYWQLYSLQTLSSDKFVKIVNKILRKEYQLFK